MQKNYNKLFNIFQSSCNIFLCRAANSMVEYSAFNRIVLGSSPRQPIIVYKEIYKEIVSFSVYKVFKKNYIIL